MKLLGAVLEARTPLDGLTDDEHGHPHYLALDPRDRALARAIVLATLRHHGRLAAILDRLVERPLPSGATALRHILLTGLAQLLLLDVPDHAVVAMAVDAARADPRSARFANLVNAVLRRAARERDELLAATADIPSAPPWYAARLRELYGADRAAAILALQQTEPPLDLAVRDDARRWAATLGGEAMGEHAVRLPRSQTAVRDLPGYGEGAWWVQDMAAGLPARLFGPLDGKRAVDLCAAPGGKTAQLVLAGADVTAVDISASRLNRLRANMDRLGIKAKTLVADIRSWDPETLFDAVLLDAPCSSTGTVRRHPDIPFTKSPEEVGKLADLQARLLDRAAAFVAPGGTLVFSNCSVDRDEGEAVVEAFLSRNRDFRLDPVTPEEVPELPQAVTAGGLVRTTPEMRPAGASTPGVDGFMAARFRRN